MSGQALYRILLFFDIRMLVINREYPGEFMAQHFFRNMGLNTQLTHFSFGSSAQVMDGPVRNIQIITKLGGKVKKNARSHWPVFFFCRRGEDLLKIRVKSKRLF